MKEKPNTKRTQEELCAKFCCEFVAAPDDSKLGLAFATLCKLPINGLHHIPNKSTNGWYIWGGEILESDPDFFSPVHTIHLYQHCPRAIPFLGLPPGYRFLLGPKRYQDVWFDPRLLEAE